MRFTNYTRDVLAATLKEMTEGDNGPCAMKIYSGTIPSTANSDDGDGSLLAQMTFTPTAFDVTDSESSSHGLLTMIGSLFEDSAPDGGTPAWGVVEDAAGNKLFDFECPAEVSVGPLSSGDQLEVTALTITIPEECG